MSGPWPVTRCACLAARSRSVTWSCTPERSAWRPSTTTIASCSSGSSATRWAATCSSSRRACATYPVSHRWRRPGGNSPRRRASRPRSGTCSWTSSTHRADPPRPSAATWRVVSPGSRGAPAHRGGRGGRSAAGLGAPRRRRGGGSRGGPAQPHHRCRGPRRCRGPGSGLAHPAPRRRPDVGVAVIRRGASGVRLMRQSGGSDPGVARGADVASTRSARRRVA